MQKLYDTALDITLKKMKHKDLRNIVKIKCENGDGPMKIFRDLSGAVSLTQIKWWLRLIRETGDIDLSKPPGGQRTARTNANFKKVKNILSKAKRTSARKMAKKLCISDRSVRRILHEDLKCSAYKIVKEPAITDLQKTKRVTFANWVLNNFNKDDTKNWLFSDEKLFDLDGVYNVQNDRIWAVSRQEGNKKGGIKKKTKFPTKVMVWLGACGEGLTTPVILDKGTVNAERYMKEVLPVALKCGNSMMGNSWTFQQDGATPHTDHRTQQWCADNMPAFVSKERWPPNSSDLNPLDYSIWNELVQTMNWDRVKTKATLITELKVAVKRIKKETVLNSVLDFTKRLRCIKESKGDYIR